MKAHGWRIDATEYEHQEPKKIDRILTSAEVHSRCWRTVDPVPPEVTIIARRTGSKGQQLSLRLTLEEKEAQDLVNRLQRQLDWIKAKRAEAEKERPQ